MKIDTYPVRYEAYDDDFGLFTLQAFDETSAELKVTAMVNADNWPQISDAILTCLKNMRLGEND